MEVKVIDKRFVGKAMADKSVLPQTMVTVFIPAEHLVVGARIRINATAYRFVGVATGINDIADPLNISCSSPDPFGQFATKIYNGIAVAQGPVIRVPNPTTWSSFSGYGAIYSPLQQALGLVKWNKQSLDDLGTIVAAIPITLVAGDLIKIEVDSLDATKFQIFVNDAVVLGPVIDADLDSNNPCTATVVLENVTKDLSTGFPPPPPEGDDSDGDGEGDDGSDGSDDESVDDSGDTDTDGSDDAGGGDGGDGGE